MKKTAVTIALSAALLASSIVGAWILSTDAWLWEAAPSHAYGLVAFVVLDLALVAGLGLGVRYARPFAFVLGTVQFFAMTGDLAGLSVPAGVSASVFRSYLLNDSPFVALLSMQPVVACLGVLSRKSDTEKADRESQN
jgi:hypothetical protein